MAAEEGRGPKLCILGAGTFSAPHIKEGWGRERERLLLERGKGIGGRVQKEKCGLQVCFFFFRPNVCCKQQLLLSKSVL